MTRLFLVRHGETEWNREMRTQGSRDIHLTERGLWQAERVSERLLGEGIEAVYSSDLKRAYYTARAIADRLGIGVKVSPDFREMNLGEWEGKRVEDIKKEFQDIYGIWVSNPHRAVIPGGETLIGVQQRAIKGIKDIIKRHQKGKIVLVSHGITIKVLIFGLLGIDLAHYRKVRMDNCGISIIDFKEEGNVLVTLNDTCHLKNGKGDGYEK